METVETRRHGAADTEIAGDTRAVRAAKNQALFREVNERIESLNVEFSRILLMSAWICECADETCFETLSLTLAEYEAIRENPARFFVLQGHEVADLETVLERHDRYTVVEKIGAGGRYAADHDPRSESRV